jgi:hypothetical protein
MHVRARACVGSPGQLHAASARQVLLFEAELQRPRSAPLLLIPSQPPRFSLFCASLHSNKHTHARAPSSFLRQAVRSLEGAVGGDAEGATLGDTVEDESALDADEASLMAGLRDDMARLLERLPAREAAVMRMRYGLEGEAYTLDDIGRILKVRPMAARGRAAARGGANAGWSAMWSFLGVRRVRKVPRAWARKVEWRGVCGEESGMRFTGIVSARRSACPHPPRGS